MKLIRLLMIFLLFIVTQKNKYFNIFHEKQNQFKFAKNYERKNQNDVYGWFLYFYVIAGNDYNWKNNINAIDVKCSWKFNFS